MRIHGLIMAIVAAVVPAAAHAESWWVFRDQGSAPSRTVSFADLDGNFTYGDGVMGWRVTAFELVGGDGVAYRREQWHYFCKTGKMALYYWETLGRDGRLIVQRRLQDNEIRYQPIVRGSTDDNFRQFYCDDPEGAGAAPIEGGYRAYRDSHFAGR